MNYSQELPTKSPRQCRPLAAFVMCIALVSGVLSPEEVHSEDNAAFVVVGFEGHVARSADGANWTHEQAIGIMPKESKYHKHVTDNTIRDLAFSDGMFIGAGHSGCSLIVSKDYGKTWKHAYLDDIKPTGTPEEVAKRSVNQGICAGEGWFVTVGVHDMNTSRDGVTWKRNRIPVEIKSRKYTDAVAYANGRFVSAGDGRKVGVFRINDKGEIEWIHAVQNVIPKPKIEGKLSGSGQVRVISNGKRFLMTHEANNGTVEISDDGITWRKAENSPSFQHGYVAKAWSGKEFMIVTEEASYVSLDGEKWTKRKHVGEVVPGGRSLAYGNGRWVMAKGSKTIFWSEDGMKWNQSSLPKGLKGGIWMLTYGKAR